jgi:hypothetical protein
MKNVNNKLIQDCIDACNACALACETCITECLQEPDVSMMVNCIQNNRECAVICRAAAEVMALGSQQSSMFCHLCAEVCATCADECEQHADTMLHCKVCAEECRRCAETCRTMVEQMPQVVETHERK